MRPGTHGENRENPVEGRRQRLGRGINQPRDAEDGWLPVLGRGKEGPPPKAQRRCHPAHTLILAC